MNRRQFICNGLKLGTAALTAGSAVFSSSELLTGKKTAAETSPIASPFIRKASHWTSLKADSASTGSVKCELCPKGCTPGPDQLGDCKARINKAGELKTQTYGRIVTAHNDPVEKKPLYHFHPGSKAFSIATAGCNLHCRFCQNWTISQALPDSLKAQYISPQDLVLQARKAGSDSIAYTYNEPTVFFEYMMDSASAAREAGLHTAMISAGFIQQPPLLELLRVLSAIKIDLKSFSDDFYREICSARLDPVKRTIAAIAQSDTWLEIVVLLIPTLNDSRDEILRLCKWLISVAGDSVPLHFSRFFPTYKLRTLPPTPPATLLMARETALEAGLKNVYIGNLPGSDGANTFCPKCRSTVISRAGYTVNTENLKNGKCGKCGAEIAGKF
ncbi:MAG: AmmeMemoRadiSam system radical SAM enzyme [Candidatus Wallbacteria bacterium HGW-Wallbacteria-1]|jgi:pyruvate formate lyase activating enzyme|uniref:AmmeMemoRadiSam system radical SAM enzyme n=1 Tax=Candidatus Wallbacteria bacterium HGW-Wallbacteria-1 TaxID=2013854 RepID=A0A2N1PII7_9BACT|nr:MAG: AmmeMemoRadiSam system radical SAM enzyme [Candidatus Wallbacteria bacterium HGW-Wallbacteria-1]